MSLDNCVHFSQHARNKGKCGSRRYNDPQQTYCERDVGHTGDCGCVNDHGFHLPNYRWPNPWVDTHEAALLKAFGVES